MIRFCAIELPESSWQSTVRDFLFYFTTWGWVVGLLGFGHLYLDRPSRALSYLAAASYPYYVIHQTAVVVIGFYVLRLDAGILPKYVFIAVATGALTLGMYELARRWSVTRALLGIRPPKLS